MRSLFYTNEVIIHAEKIFKDLLFILFNERERSKKRVLFGCDCN